MTAIGLKRILIITAIITIIFISSIALGMAEENLSQYYDKVLFSDEFEHGTSNWELTQAWRVTTDGNNTYLVGEYTGDKAKTNWVIWNPDPLRLRLIKFDNYTFAADFKLDSGMISFNYRDVNEPSYPPNRHYSVQVNRAGNYLTIDINKNGALTQPTYTQARVPGADGWHKIEITGRGTEIQVQLDGKLVMTYVDEHNPYLAGGAAFEIPHGTLVAVDNIRLLGGADTTVTDQRYIIYLGFLLVVIVIISIVFGLNYYLKKRRALKVSKVESKPTQEAQAPAIKAQMNGAMAIPDAQKATSEPGPRVVGHDVFISYSHDDKPTADAICAGLEAEGIKCWIAPRDVLPGAIFQEAIIDAIDSSSIMVVVYSSKSNNSPHVVRELSRAVSKDVIIIPFRIEDVPLSKTMEYLISVPHWLDAITPPVEMHISELVRVAKVNLDIKRKKSN
ncbi:hypothetical protein MCP_2201 [Methanocella paludicola SANAE]|uniref:TIR domain-containing protein n=1 Tax=Methanocella paludicola (strain DSM 17711 / JCM 13418 / NBRC 101707 / SANAE) TaxID=304371 RepID=D1Z0Q1_METPS|nr:TIR domain-containing protein [Methanocella paludicola]BAI62273.1 hypothetical protein MCP_2201 [Methanocella paludicola SANAE]